MIKIFYELTTAKRALEQLTQKRPKRTPQEKAPKQKRPHRMRPKLIEKQKKKEEKRKKRELMEVGK